MLKTASMLSCNILLSFPFHVFSMISTDSSTED